MLGRTSCISAFGGETPGFGNGGRAPRHGEDHSRKTRLRDSVPGMLQGVKQVLLDLGGGVDGPPLPHEGVPRMMDEDCVGALRGP